MKRVIGNYRKQIKSVSSGVHPMEYWEKEGQARRWAELCEVFKIKI